MVKENLHNTFDVFFTPAFLQLKNNDGSTRRKIVSIGLPIFRGVTDFFVYDLVEFVANGVLTDAHDYELVETVSGFACSTMLLANVFDFFATNIKAREFDVK